MPVENLDANLPIATIEGDVVKATVYFEDYLFNLVKGLGGEGSTSEIDDLEKQLSDAVNSVINARLLGGQTSAYHLARTNHTGTEADAAITESSVTQHEAALSITISQITDFVTATTSELVDISDSINTGAAKELGYMVLNTTTGLTVFASGNTDGAVWHFYDSSTAHTPA